MQQFDSYIKSIVKDLNISKRQKYEMTEEFKDHLEMLKQEFDKDGFNKEVSINKAIDSFGNDKEIKKKIAESIYSYRTLPNIMVGLLFYFLFFYSMILLYEQYKIRYIFNGIVHIILVSIFMSCIGYFLPIIFNGMRNVYNIIIVTTVLIILFFTFQERYIIPEHISDIYYIFILYLRILPEVIISGPLGYMLLKGLNIVTLRYKDKIYNRIKN